MKTQGTLLDIVGTGGDGACTDQFIDVRHPGCLSQGHEIGMIGIVGLRRRTCSPRTSTELDLDDVTKCIDDAASFRSPQNHPLRASWRRCGSSGCPDGLQPPGVADNAAGAWL